MGWKGSFNVVSSEDVVTQPGATGKVVSLVSVDGTLVSDGDDAGITKISVQIESPTSHLKLGDRVDIEADC